MSEKFIVDKSNSGDNWLICWTGQDAQGNHFNVTTNNVHASSLHNYTRGADGDAELIARLLNWYYSDQNAAEQSMHLTDGTLRDLQEVMEISESTSIDDLLQIVFDEDDHSGVERMYACQCIRRKFEAAQQSVQPTMGGYAPRKR